MLFPNWADYFKSHADHEMGNQNNSIYSSAWGQNKDHATKLALLTNDPNIIILGADTEGTIIPLHSFSNLGGSLSAQTTSSRVLLAQANRGSPSLLLKTQQLWIAIFKHPPPTSSLPKRPLPNSKPFPIPPPTSTGGSQILRLRHLSPSTLVSQHHPSNKIQRTMGPDLSRLQDGKSIRRRTRH